MAAPVLGIDLGTTNSVVAVSDGREVRTLPVADDRFLIPSVVSFHPDGSVLVGDPARERRLIDAKNTVFSIKRLIGRPFRSEEVRRATERFPFELRASPTGGVLVSARGETYSLSEISAFVLREVRRIADQALGETCTRAVVTVPANFNELQRSATKTAGRVAGLEVLRILNEPTAAALAYGYGRGSRERVAIFDLGGGTFDVTILELAGDVFEVLATAGDTYLGGDDIDEVLADRMAKAFLKHHRYDARTDRQAYERLRAAAEWSKCQLSHEEEVKLRIEELAFGEGGVPLDLAFGLKRRNLEAMIQPLVARCFDVCEDAMRGRADSPHATRQCHIGWRFDSHPPGSTDGGRVFRSGAADGDSSRPRRRPGGCGPSPRAHRSCGTPSAGQGQAQAGHRGRTGARAGRAVPARRGPDKALEVVRAAGARGGLGGGDGRASFRHPGGTPGAGPGGTGCRSGAPAPAVVVDRFHAARSSGSGAASSLAGGFEHPPRSTCPLRPTVASDGFHPCTGNR